MSRAAVEMLIWGLTAAVILMAAAERPRISLQDQSTTMEQTMLPVVGGPAHDALSSSARLIIAANPFRLSRRAAAVPFGSDLSTATATPPTVPATPLLLLRGIIGGPPWEAIIEGIPARPAGVLVRDGDIHGELRIARISFDAVVIEHGDTSWILTLERP